MRKAIGCILAMVVLAGCSTLRKDQKRLAIIEVRNTQLLANTCAEKFPPKLLPPVIKEGATKVISDTVIIEGKRIPCPPVIVNKDTVINWVDCPPSKKIHDTIVRVDTAFIQVANTAELAAKDYELMQVRDKLQKSEDKASRRGKTILYLIIGLILSVGWNFRKLIFKMFV